MRVTVVGLGYVGLSNAVLFAQKNQVIALDIDPLKVSMINDRVTPIKDCLIKEYLDNKKLDLKATCSSYDAYSEADLVLIATPTDYDSEQDYFNTSSIETVLSEIIEINREAIIVIKSTVPVGFTEKISKKFNQERILFSPEFLREGSALYDCLYPTRIVVGGNSDLAKKYVDLVVESTLKEDIPTIYTEYCEAEAIKLFSNTYLALRVAYFNEIDTYAEICGLNVKKIIEAVSLDPRIGDYYNNPSFGYGGYCLPKDTKQLRANYSNIPHSLISAVVEANSIRKDHISNRVLQLEPKVIGIYKLAMKQGSDNFRGSSMHGIIKRIQESNIEVIIYEPQLDVESFSGAKVIKCLSDFKKKSDVILTNRNCDQLNDVIEKVYSRDLFGAN